MSNRYGSIGQKYLGGILTTTLITLAITIAATGIYEWDDYKKRWIEDLSNQARVIGAASIPALQFDDAHLAYNNLALLKLRPEIVAGAISDEKGNVFASYNQSNKPLESLKTEEITSIEGDNLLLTRQIKRDEDVVGYIQLKAKLGIASRLANYFAILGFIAALAFLFALYIAKRLQQQITQPIEAVADLSRKIVEERDYSSRAVKTSNDEVGGMVDAVNTMLQEIQNRTETQEKLVQELAEEVESRKKAEAALRQAHDQLEVRVKERTMQLRNTEQALLQSQKLEAIGQLTGGVAHDFNNILQVIGTNLELMRIKFAGQSALVNHIDRASEAVKRGAKLASQLLAYARKQPLQPTATNLNNLLKGLDDLLHRALGETVKLEINPAEGLWNVLVDRNQFENVIINLAINARDAMENGGVFRITTENMLFNEGDRTESDHYVTLIVEDTGSGMTPEVRDKAFEPFFTTKADGRGTGLGLSMVYGVVKQSGGHIELASEVGRGTRFQIYLPATDVDEAATAKEATPEILQGNAVILVVEDEPEVMSSTLEMLEASGYKVFSATDAQSALSLLQSGLKVDLVFSDVVMPGPMKSSEMAKHAKEILPEVQILFTSGYTRDAMLKSGKLEEGVHLLNKPYQWPDLIAKIEKLLGNAKA